MSQDAKTRPSFSPARRWGIGLDMALRTALVLAVVVMVNYLSAHFLHRYYLSSQTNVKLSSRTLNVLRSLTNTVNVTLYYDREDGFLPDIVTLLDQYHAANPKIVVRVVDFVNHAGEAEKVKEKYKLGSVTEKNLVIFDLNGRVKIIPGDAITQYKLEQVQNEKDREFRKKPVSFFGEKFFTSMLLALNNPQPLKAYFLQGHGEPSLMDNGSFGYQKFGQTLEQNYVAVTNFEFVGDSPVPLDCNLLVIVAPQDAFAEPELQKVDKYLTEGGRLLLLFNAASVKNATGLEPILQRWGVNVPVDIVQDPNTMTGQDVIVRQFGQHPVVNALTDNKLQIVLPRPVAKVNWPNPPASAPQVSELAFSSAQGTLVNNRSEPPQSYPLMVAVEQKPVAGVTTLRGNTRMIVTGDSFFLVNHYIEAGVNRDFLNSAVNWLLDRPQLVEGIGPRPVTEFRLLLTKPQQQQLRWLLLGALPGGVLVLGWLVWLVRRQ